MKRLAVLLLAGLSLTACAAKSHTSSPQAQQQEQAAVSVADKAVQRCLPVKDGAPNFLVLRSHTARHKFMNCAVPPAQRAAFDACLTKVFLGGLPAKARIESGARACLAKVER